ncbi:MAG: N-acyl homoserine lactonase family protein [Pseudomonadota bacterium]
MTSFCFGLEPGKVTDVPLICWYIEGSDKKILVDTGGGDPFKAQPTWKPFKREEFQTIEAALQRVGVKCEDIEVLIVTHLHWDHCGGNDLFPMAKIFLQEKELQSARSPFPIHAHGYIQNMIENIDYTVISGDREIAGGVRVIHTPGHTYGMQGVLVECKETRYFIAGDTFGFFKNLEKEPPLPGGVYVDLKQYYESMEKITRLSAFILPGHDFKVFDREVYY